jgi:UDP-N-acetylmuramoylalanine--D-glutamate ligase
MLAAILASAGLSTAALGNIGEPLVDAARAADRFDVLAVELSSFQLHWSSTLAPRAGALLNLAEDHLEWHASFAEYTRAKTEVWRAAAGGAGGSAPGLAVGNLDDPLVSAALARVGAAQGPAGRVGSRSVGVRLGEPGPGELGVVDGRLVDRAFPAGDPGAGPVDPDAGPVDPDAGPGDTNAGPVDLGPVDAVRPAGAHNVSNALHAAALARSFGVAPAAVAAGLAGYTPAGHRNALVGTVDGVAYVDDSKATNPHAARASLTAYPRVVWIAGGQLKGVEVGELVATVAGRLAGAVLLGVDRASVATALARHAPHIPVVDVSRTDDGAMAEVVNAAAALARAGDTVLLAPAAASKDMFASYAHRGAAFASAVGTLARRRR